MGMQGVRRVSVAVRSVAQALAFYRDALGLEVVLDIDLPERGLRLIRLTGNGADVDLLEPTDDATPVGEFIERYGEGLYHLAIEVDDIELEMRTLIARNVDLIDREPRSGPDGRVAFVNPRSTGGVLVELSEPGAVPVQHVAPRPSILPPDRAESAEHAAPRQPQPDQQERSAREGTS